MEVTGPRLAQSKPIIVKIIQPKDDALSGLADVFVNAIGITGAIVLAALVLGAVFAAVMYVVRSRRPLQ